MPARIMPRMAGQPEKEACGARGEVLTKVKSALAIPVIAKSDSMFRKSSTSARTTSSARRADSAWPTGLPDSDGHGGRRYGVAGTATPSLASKPASTGPRPRLAASSAHRPQSQYPGSQNRLNINLKHGRPRSDQAHDASLGIVVVLDISHPAA